MIRYVLPIGIILYLLLVGAQLDPAAASVDPEATDRSDAAGPGGEVRSLRPGPDIGPLLEALCPGEVVVDGQSAACRTCPDQALRSRGRLSVRRAFLGGFSQTGDDVAILSLRGCATKNIDRHASAFLERGDQGWNLVDYRHGMNTSGCRIETVDDRTVLVCHSRTVGDGNSSGAVFGIDYDHRGWHIDQLAALHTNTDPCRYQGHFRRTLRSIYVGEMSDQGEAIAVLLEDHHGAPQDDDVPCKPDFYDLSSSLELMIFAPTSQGFDAIPFDDLCGHPGRAAFVNAIEPGGCS